MTNSVKRERTMPRNLQAILDWVEKNRPDCLAQVTGLIDQDAAILLMTMAFEAGREFQRENPTAPVGPEVYTPAVKPQVSNSVKHESYVNHEGCPHECTEDPAQSAGLVLDALRDVRDRHPRAWDALLGTTGGPKILSLWDTLKALEPERKDT